MIARRSLGSTVIDTPLTAVSAPKLWVRFRISRRGRFSVISPLVIFGHLTAQLVRRAASLRTATRRGGASARPFFGHFTARLVAAAAPRLAHFSVISPLASSPRRRLGSQCH